jgi:TATA-box binding protein (TBP) (component of TFIID and TFIIIB)
MTTSIKYQDFDDIVVSTKTFIVKTNLVIDLKKLFDYLPVTDYVQLPKKRGRKKKIVYEEQNKDVVNGSIITLKYENQIKGVDLKIRKSKKKKSKWFRNSFTVVIIIDCKPINFKICQNGMFQITGAKFDSQAEECIKYIWQLIHDQNGSIYNYSKGSSMEAIFIPAMRNIDFNLGFFVDREKLTRYMNTQTEFHSLLETSFGYTGVNIKFPIKDDIREMKLKKMGFKDGEIVTTTISYGEYLGELTEKEQQKKLKKNRYTTFLCFQSGKTICSGITAELTKPAYNYFLDIIRRCRHEIEEKLDV